MTNLDSILKSRHYFASKGPSSQGYGFSCGHVWMRSGLWRRLSAEELMLLNCGVGEDSWGSLGLQGDPTSPFLGFKTTSKLYIDSICYRVIQASLVAQTVERLPAMRETRVWFLGQEDPLEKEMASHSSTLAWKIPWREEPDRLQSMGSQRVEHDWATSLSLSL